MRYIGGCMGNLDSRMQAVILFISLIILFGCSTANTISKDSLGQAKEQSVVEEKARKVGKKMKQRLQNSFSGQVTGWRLRYIAMTTLNGLFR